MRTKTDTILTIMQVVAWIAFIGLLIKTGAQLVSYGVSMYNPEGAKNFYNGLDLYNLRQYDTWYYTCFISLRIALVALQAYTAYLVITTLSKVNMANPFTEAVSRMLENVSYYILCSWGVSLIYNGYAKWVSKKVAGIEYTEVTGEYLFLAGVVFVMAQIFKKGVELQTENELTV